MLSCFQGNNIILVAAVGFAATGFSVALLSIACLNHEYDRP